jgi:hypothetical protein
MLRERLVPMQNEKQLEAQKKKRKKAGASRQPALQRREERLMLGS